MTLKLRELHASKPNPVNADKHNRSFKFSWESNKSEKFRTNLLSDPVQKLFNDSVDTVFEDINRSIEYITEALKLAASDMKRQIGSFPRGDNSNSWFDYECECLKRDRCNVLKILRV